VEDAKFSRLRRFIGKGVAYSFCFSVDKVKSFVEKMGVARMTNIEAKRAMNPTAEIDLLIYSGCQTAAIYRLTDLVRITGEWSGNKSRLIRVTH